MYVVNQTHPYTVTRHVCPRNCYDACSMLAYSRNGIIEKVEGDPANAYTNGKLCSKGYSYLGSVYHRDRLKHPMIQIPRGSGNWKRISWDEAIDLISDKILTLHDRTHSNLSLCLNKYSGNMGLMHLTTEALFDSIGATTRVVGSPCWSAGLDAQYYDFGANTASDPSEIERAKCVILWGANPAWTAIHSLPYIYKAQENGAKVIVIDPVRTITAKKADIYIQIAPSTDGALALAIAKVLLNNNLYDHDFVTKYSHGWPIFKDYLESLDLDELCTECEVASAVVHDLAATLAACKQSFFWLGFGLQRHSNGGQNIRAIQAIAAMIGAIGEPGGGVNFASMSTWLFNAQKRPETQNRLIPINQFTHALHSQTEPPIKMLWIACRNILTQDPAPQELKLELEKLEFIVTVDQFMTPTAECADIVLPTTTFFEEEDIVTSYWQQYISYNEKAIENYEESKSDFEISKQLSQALNRKRPGFSTFNASSTPHDFIENEFNEDIYRLLGIVHWSELQNGSKKVKLAAVAWADKQFKTESKKFEFYSNTALADGFPPFATFTKGKRTSKELPFWLLTTHAQFGLNSQFQNIEGLADVDRAELVYINPTVALENDFTTGSTVTIYNDLGEIDVHVAVSSDIPEDVLLFHQGWHKNSQITINQLIPSVSTDMGKKTTMSQGIAYYDAFVAIRKRER